MPRIVVDPQDFEQIVNAYYEGLYRFALSLAQREAEASDLTQQTFYLWATKGHQLRDKTKIKSWLFTTLYREFLGSRRKANRFPHYEMDAVDNELPTVTADMVKQLDAQTVVQCLMHVDELYRAPLVLFYLQEHSYAEIAELLEIPIGTVMSRLSRGKRHLRQLLTEQTEHSNVVPLNTAPTRRSQLP